MPPARHMLRNTANTKTRVASETYDSVRMAPAVLSPAWKNRVTASQGV